MHTKIDIKGASLHNLKHIDVEIPHNAITVITGVSGSGKSSLAFDTIYAEGQRRFVESLSAYARQFLERMTKPDVEKISGILPAVAIDQKAPSKNPRSTVGTSTEIYDYIRLLYGRIGTTICYKCGKQVRRDNPQAVTDLLMEKYKGDKIFVLYPVDEKKNVEEEIENAIKQGFFRIYLSNSDEIINFQDDERKKLDINENVHILTDRLVVRDDKDSISRMTESIEAAFSLGMGRIVIRNIDKNISLRFSTNFECADCDIVYQVPEPRLFSFNNPFGACHVCQGFGKAIGIDKDLVIPDKSKSLINYAVVPFKSLSFKKQFNDLVINAKRLDIPVYEAISTFSFKQLEMLWQGDEKWGGINSFFAMLEEGSYKMNYKMLLNKYRGYTQCPKCGGSRIRTSARQVFIDGKNIPEIVKYPIDKALEFFENIQLSEHQLHIAEQVLKEIVRRLRLLVDIGLHYLSLDRLTHTLSGGESQRISLSTAIGSSLVDTLYVLDEPSIGLHARDTDRLVNILKKLRNMGNTVIVVEHDPDVMKHADYIIDMGPKAGNFGGEICFSGVYKDLIKADTLTAKYLSGQKTIDLKHTTADFRKKLLIKKPNCNNLRMEKIEIPLECTTVITGVSGSGKSTLVHDIIYNAINKMKSGYNGICPEFESIEGIEYFDNIEMVDQSAIGKSSRSTPITYTKAFESIRELFSETQLAKQMGCKPGYFSFNVPGGRCEECEGEGTVSIDMQFLPDVHLVCESCHGTRYKKEARNILYKGKSIVDVLNMTVDTAVDFFVNDAKVLRRLQPLKEIGLGYLQLGQSGSMLSGGEAQRIKLASAIDTNSFGKTLYIFDEPTTGLHLDDISKLLASLKVLIDKGHSVLIIEHNLNVIANADWIIDLGPEGGYGGGLIVAEGTPEAIAKAKNSYTGMALKEFYKSYKMK